MPCVCGCAVASCTAHGAGMTSHQVRDGDTVILDAGRGVLLADVAESTLKSYRRKQRERQKQVGELDRLKSAPAVTGDGVSASACSPMWSSRRTYARRAAPAPTVSACTAPSSCS